MGVEKRVIHTGRYALPLLILAVGAAALWPVRHALTAETIAALSPRQTFLAASFLVGLYALKSLSICFPMSALTAAGGLLFPFPLALAVNLCGTAVAQTIPFFLGRREQGGTGGPGGAVSPGGGHLPGPGGGPVAVRVSAAAGGRVAGGCGEPVPGGLRNALRRLSLRRAAGGTAPDRGGYRPGRRPVGAGQPPVLALPGGGRGTDGPLRCRLASAAAPAEVKGRLLFSAKPCTLLSVNPICPMREMVPCRR